MPFRAKYGCIKLPFLYMQRYPAARELIKYLVADGWYDYLGTRSLISLRMRVEDIVISSEEGHVEMFPMDDFEDTRPLGQAMHKRVMNDFRQYLLRKIRCMEAVEILLAL